MYFSRLHDVVDHVMGILDSDKDRNSVSLVCKDWYESERRSRTRMYIQNCYSVSPEIVSGRFSKIRSVRMKEKTSVNVHLKWGADIQHRLVVFATKYPFLEELKLKRMTVTDESLKFLARLFSKLKALSFRMCDGFSTDGLASIATHCKNLVELSLKDNEFDGKSGGWLSCLPETFTSLEILNFASMNTDVDFDSLERLVSRCKSLKVLKVNKNITLEQLGRLLNRAQDLVDLGTGSFKENITGKEYEYLCGIVETKCTKQQTLSGL